MHPPPSLPPPAERPSTEGRAYAYLIGLVWVVPAALVTAGALFLPDSNADGGCEGIGFGCVPAPSDAVVLVGFLVSPLLAVGGLFGLTLIASFRRRWPGFARCAPSLQALAVTAVLVALAGLMALLT